jgi:hypothetical protein
VWQADVTKEALIPDNTRVRFAASLETFAAGSLIVPTAMMALAVAGFALGYSIGSWVVPLAVVIMVLGVRGFTSSWSEALLLASMVALTHVVAGVVSGMFPDNSWDGLVYQQEAVLRLAAGWNPFYEDAAAYGLGNDPFINHYAKLSWINGAALLLGTGHIEIGKLFNFTFMLAAAAQVISLLLRLTAMRLQAAIGIAAVAALNPVAIYQSTTYYVDGTIANVLTVLVAALTAFVATRRLHFAVVAVLAACIVINLKFTGLAYAAVLLLLAVPVAWRFDGIRAGARMVATGVVAAIAGILLLGYSPYVRNVVEHGDPFYSAPHADIASVRPLNINDKNRFTRFLVSNFSRTDMVRAPQSTQLKFPLSASRGELRGVYGADLEVGGFGPWYGALLVLALVGAVALLVHATTRRASAAALLIAGCVIASMFVHGETWWARYIAQGWLIPILVAVPCLGTARRSLRWWLGCSIVAAASVNLLVVAANVGWNRLAYIKTNRESLAGLQSAPQPVPVYFGPFRALRQRLHEAGVTFTEVEDLPDAAIVRHPLPVPGQGAFWLECGAAANSVGPEDFDGPARLAPAPCGKKVEPQGQ